VSTDSSDENENAFDSIRVNREFDPNEIDEGDEHCDKYNNPSVSTFRGISIDSRAEHENALDSTRLNRELDSNEIHERE
jgi:hypothetical protein